MTDFEKKNLWNSIATIRWFMEEQCEERGTISMVVKEDKTELSTDWGYFEEGLDEIEKWLDKRIKVTEKVTEKVTDKVTEKE